MVNALKSFGDEIGGHKVAYGATALIGIALIIISTQNLNTLGLNGLGNQNSNILMGSGAGILILDIAIAGIRSRKVSPTNVTVHELTEPELESVKKAMLLNQRLYYQMPNDSTVHVFDFVDPEDECDEVPREIVEKAKNPNREPFSPKAIQNVTQFKHIYVSELRDDEALHWSAYDRRENNVNKGIFTNNMLSCGSTDLNYDPIKNFQPIEFCYLQLRAENRAIMRQKNPLPE